METKKDNPITLTAEQVGELRRYHSVMLDSANRLTLLSTLFDTEVVSLDESACIGIVSIIDEICTRITSSDTTTDPFKFLFQKHDIEATA